MTKIKVKKINLKQLFLGIVAISILPIIMSCILMFLATPAGSASLLYCITLLILGPLLYGLVGVIFGLGYNWLSPKIGQFELEIEIEDKCE